MDTMTPTPQDNYKATVVLGAQHITNADDMHRYLETKEITMTKFREYTNRACAVGLVRQEFDCGVAYLTPTELYANETW